MKQSRKRTFPELASPQSRLFFFLLFLLVSGGLAQPRTGLCAAGPVTYQPGREHYSLDLHLDILEDRDGSLTFAKISSPRLAQQYRTNLENKPNLGFSSSAFWVRFATGGNFDPKQEWLLELEYSLLDRVDIYLPQNQGGYLLKEIGDQLPFREREIEHRNLVVSLTPSALSGAPIYLRIQSESTISLPMAIWSRQAFIKHEHREQFVFGLYYGIILVMVVYSFLLLLTLRDLTYFYYLLFILDFGLYQAIMHGIAYEYLWPEHPWWNSNSMPLIGALGAIGIILFTMKFLDTARQTPLLHRLLLCILAAAAALAPMPFLSSYSLAIRAMILLDTITISTVMVTGIVCMFYRYRPARYFVIAWLMFFLGIIIQVLRVYGLLNNEAMIINAPQIGSVFTIILLALALADRIDAVRKQATEAQEQFQSIFNNSTEGIFRTSAAGAITMVNPALATIFGYSSPAEALATSPNIDTIYVNPE